MIPPKIKDIILSKRISRKDLSYGLHTEDYFKEVIDIWKISDIDIIVCNTLQRRTSLTLSDKYSIVVFDNYLLELIQMFNNLSTNTDDRIFKYIYCKLIYESYFLHDNKSLVEVNKELFEKISSKIDSSFIKPFNNFDYDILTVQQIFMIAHEIMHCYFRRSPDSLNQQIENITKFLNKLEDGVIKLSKMSDMEIQRFHENTTFIVDGNPINKTSSNNVIELLKIKENYMEEICCDNLAATLTLSVTIEKYGIELKKVASSLFKALSSQFIIFCTDKFVENNFNSDALKDFTNRLLILRFTINNYCRVRQANFADSISTYLSKEYNNWISSTYNKYIQFLILQKSIRHYYENGEDIKSILNL